MVVFYLDKSTNFRDFLNLMQNMLIETDGLDQIRPNYDATLEIRAVDKPFFVKVDCKGTLLFYSISL